jgi:quinol monooxygenase YgiN
MPNVVLIAQLQADPDKGDGVVEAVLPHLESFRPGPPGLQRSCYRSIDDRDRFAIYAEYLDAGDLTADQESPNFVELSQAVRPLIREVTWSRYEEDEPHQPVAQPSPRPGLVVIGQSQVAPGMAGARKAGQAQHLAAVKASEPGCLRFSHFHSIDDPDRIAVYEEYVNADDFAAHQNSEHFKVAVETLGHLLLETVWSRYEELKG